MIQENGGLNGAGTFLNSSTLPDDDGNGGEIIFDFNAITHGPITDLSLEWVDIDPPTGVNYRIVLEDTFSGLSATVNFNQFITPGDFWYDSTMVFGDHTANRFPKVRAEDLFLNAAGAPAAPMSFFNRVTFFLDAAGGFGSSGSVATVSFTQLDSVPEPSRVLLLGGGLAMALLRRRRG